MKKSTSINFSSALRVPKFLFSIFGTLFMHNENKPKTKWYYFRLVYFWGQYGLLCCAIFNYLGIILYLGKNAESIEKSFFHIMELVSYITFVGLSLFKILSASYVHNQNIWIICDKLKNLFPENHKHQIKFEIKSYINQTNLFLKSYGILFVTLIWVFNLLPIFDSYYHYHVTKIWIRKLPYDLWYPFNPYVNILYEINYISQILLASNSMVGGIAVDVLLCALISQICLQFKILKDEMVNLGYSSENENWKMMCKCIEKHVKLIELTNQLENCFSISMLLHFVGSAFVLCSTLFLTVAGINKFDLLKFTIFFISSVVEIFVLCWYGNWMIESVSLVLF